MRTTRINNSSTIARYRVEFDSFTERDMKPDVLADFLEPNNYGARWAAIGDNHALLEVYID